MNSLVFVTTSFFLINFAWNGSLLPDRELKGNNSSYKSRIKFEICKWLNFVLSNKIVHNLFILIWNDNTTIMIIFQSIWKNETWSYKEINIIMLFTKLISSKYPEYIDFLFLWEFVLNSLVCSLYHYQDCFTTQISLRIYRYSTLVLHGFLYFQICSH
jgi:hypothetical protein